MPDEEIDKILDIVLEFYMNKENEKAEKELKKLESEKIEFSNEHQKKMRKIFKEYRKNLSKSQKY